MATDPLGLKNDYADQSVITDEWLNAVADELNLAVTQFGALFGAGVIGSTGFNLTIVAGQIALEISAGYAIVGNTKKRLVYLPATEIIGVAQGLGASSTRYVFLLREPTDPLNLETYFTANTSGTAPANSILIGTAVFNATEATSVDQLPQGRINLRNPIVLSGLAADRPTFGVVGRFYFATDTAGGTLYYDTGAAWQTVAAPSSGGTFTGAVVIQPATDVLPLQIVIPSGAAGATGFLDIVDSTLALSLARIASSQLTLKPASTGSAFYEAYGWGTSLTIGMLTRGAGGSRGSETDVAINQVNGRWAATGWGGSAYRFGGYIYCKASEAFAAGAAGSRWEIHTAPIGSVTPAEIMRMASAGVNIGGAANNNASALFQVDSTTQGAAFPRMTTAQRDAIGSPLTGLWIHNTTTKGPNFYNGSAWEEHPSSVNRPAQITADQNNYALGTGKSQFLSTDAARTLTGIVATYDGDRRTIVNNGSQNLILANQHASSTAANRILTGTGADVTIAADGIRQILYDATLQRWRLI